jgi:hypothetical protein
MPTAHLGRFSVVPTDGLYVVVDRVAKVPARLTDGNPAIFAIAKDAFLWAICRLIADKAGSRRDET